MTKDLEIHIIELPRFKGNLETLETELENWVYLLREAGQLKEREMSDLKIKNPVIREAVEALQDISLDNKTRNYYEMRLKAARDYEAMKDYAYKEGRKSGFEAGIEKGIEKGREQERLLAQEEIEKTQRLASIREKRAEHKKALRTAINLKKEGAELKFISRITELPEAYLERFFRKAFGD
ncbi:MAG: PD-(D/E)XK nuclease family transposase [Leptospiraceae bacterium]|nr:PD-(D/E)XK nuclease family transposase [Leptospiraceae bacterium]